MLNIYTRFLKNSLPSETLIIIRSNNPYVYNHFLPYPPSKVVDRLENGGGSSRVQTSYLRIQVSSVVCFWRIEAGRIPWRSNVVAAWFVTAIRFPWESRRTLLTLNAIQLPIMRNILRH